MDASRFHKSLPTPPHIGQPELSPASPVSPEVAKLVPAENHPEGDEKDSVTRNTVEVS